MTWEEWTRTTLNVPGGIRPETILRVWRMGSISRHCPNIHHVEHTDRYVFKTLFFLTKLSVKEKTFIIYKLSLSCLYVHTNNVVGTSLIFVKIIVVIRTIVTNSQLISQSSQIVISRSWPRATSTSSSPTLDRGSAYRTTSARPQNQWTARSLKWRMRVMPPTPGQGGWSRKTYSSQSTLFPRTFPVEDIPLLLSKPRTFLKTFRPFRVSPSLWNLRRLCLFSRWTLRGATTSRWRWTCRWSAPSSTSTRRRSARSSTLSQYRSTSRYRNACINRPGQVDVDVTSFL